MTTAPFASAGDLEEQVPRLDELGPGCFGFVSRHDPNCGFVVGRDAVLVVDTRATPRLARELREAIRSVTDRPVRFVFLSHYHAVRTLGASAFEGVPVIASRGTAQWIAERGEADFASELDRFPRLFRGVEEIPGLTRPALAFEGALAVDLGGGVEVELRGFGRAHTQGDAAAWVPSQGVLFAGDLVENGVAVYAGDAYIADWLEALPRVAAAGARALLPGRGAAVRGAEVAAAIGRTAEFLTALRDVVGGAMASGGEVAACFRAAEAAMRPRFGEWPVFEHALPFDVARMREELSGGEHPTVWTAERDKALWAALRGGGGG